MATGNLPFYGFGMYQIKTKICKGVYRCPPYLSPALVHLISWMLQTNPAHRCTIKDIKNHPWIRQYSNIPRLMSFRSQFKNSLKDVEEAESESESESQCEETKSDSEDELLEEEDESGEVAQGKVEGTVIKQSTGTSKQSQEIQQDSKIENTSEIISQQAVKAGNDKLMKKKNISHHIIEKVQKLVSEKRCRFKTS